MNFHQDNSALKLFKCFKCDQAFDRASQLDYHARNVHLGEKSQICQICGKGFFRKADLKTHLNIHLGTNHSVCEICGRKFNHVSNFIRHSRIHAGLKPYPCLICGKRFTQVSSLVRHKHIHENNEKKIENSNNDSENNEFSKIKKTTRRRHYCKTCGDSFEFMFLLRQHEKVHIDRTYTMKCINCDQVLQNQEAFNQHICNQNAVQQADQLQYRNIEDEINSLECINHSPDASINISDILSSYFDHEFVMPDTISKDDDCESLKKKINSELLLNESRNKSLHVEVNQLLIEVCESEHLKALDIHQTHDNHMISQESNDNDVDNICDKSFIFLSSTLDKTFKKHQDNNRMHSSVSDEHMFNVDEQKEFQSTDKSIESSLMCSVDNVIGCNSNSSDNNDINKDIDASTIHLVQNIGGEEFFELVRDHLEFLNFENINNININTNCMANQDFLSTTIINTSANSKPLSNTRTKIFQNQIKKKPHEKSHFTVSKDKLKCNVCYKSFSTASNLKQHAGMHFFDHQKFKCKECGVTFAWKSTLNKHMANIHRPDGKQKFVCELCPKSYGTLSQVYEHVKRDHLKQRNHVCSTCGKVFFKKFDLKSHQRIHTNERPYICKNCGKGFHHRSHIIRHERIHSGERPYSCDICDKNFIQSSSLKNHLQRHHPNMNKVDSVDCQADVDDPMIINAS